MVEIRPIFCYYQLNFMEKEPFRKIELKPLEPLEKEITRRQFFVLGLLGVAAAGGSLSLHFLSSRKSKRPEITPTISPPPTLSKAPEKPTPVRTPTLEATPTPLKEYLIGGINFVDGETIDIAYPGNFEGTEKVEFENLQIFVSNESGGDFKTLSEFGSENKVMVYQDIPNKTLILNLRGGHHLLNNEPKEAEPLRELIEGNKVLPYPEEKIKPNLKKIIGLPFFISQKGQISRFVITQAKRINAEETRKIFDKPEDLSLFLKPIENPQNSFLLLICSSRQLTEPFDGLFSGRYVFVLQHSPLE